MRAPMLLIAFMVILTGVFPGLMLAPLNAALAEYGMPSLYVAFYGLAAGPGAWDATAVAVLMLVAFGGCWLALRFLLSRVKIRVAPPHACGHDASREASRIPPEAIYPAPVSYTHLDVYKRQSGDSMEPAIMDNDIVLIDQGKRDVTPGRLYAIGFDEAIYLKRIDILPGKVILKRDVYKRQVTCHGPSSSTSVWGSMPMSLAPKSCTKKRPSPRTTSIPSRTYRLIAAGVLLQRLGTMGHQLPLGTPSSSVS